MRYLSVAAAVLIGATAVYAQSGADAIKQRQAAMEAMSKAGKSNATMIKGDAPFDAAKAKANFKVIEDAASKSKTLFGPDTKTGADTAALPAIWSKNSEFVARFDKLAAAAKTAQAAATSKEALATQARAVGANCGGCHKEYRARN